jgi:hypothetical protein
LHTVKEGSAREFSRTKKADEFLEDYEEGLVLDPYDVALLGADNYQLKRPETHGYDHWFTVLYTIFNLSKLKKRIRR